MNKNTYHSVIATGIAMICFSLLMASTVSATNIIYPGNPNWSFDARGSAGEAYISADKPRSGNASLALTTSGSLNDWAFYTRYADSYYGHLSDIDALSFDWLRGSNTVIPDGMVSWDPWLVQTPVLRLLIRDNILADNGDIAGTFTSELVWEKYYTDTNNNFKNMIIGDWVDQNLIGQNFWRHLISIEGYTLDTGVNISPYTHNELLMASSTLDWALNGEVAYQYTSDAVVYGLSVGVGSMWPAQYYGYVDNILLAFNGEEPVINDNFELPVPEPATFLLFGTGIGIMALGRRMRKKRHNA
jgi:hypothetical protein